MGIRLLKTVVSAASPKVLLKTIQIIKELLLLKKKGTQRSVFTKTHVHVVSCIDGNIGIV